MAEHESGRERPVRGERLRQKRGTAPDRKAGGRVNLVVPGRGRDSEQPPNPRKICVIGFHKTGTTSLNTALRSLGFSTAYVANELNQRVKNGVIAEENIDRDFREIALEAAARADGVQDNPYPLIFRELDQRFPGSKFIFLEREPNSWLESLKGFVGGADRPLREWIYGAGAGNPAGHEQLYLDRYNRHREEVFEYFADRRDDLLVMDLKAGDGWWELVNFLQQAELLRFPHRNKASPK